MSGHRKDRKALVLGHRGAPGCEAGSGKRDGPAPCVPLPGSRPLIENTLASIGAAIDAGADGVEIDIRLSSDDVVVVIHDDTLDRTGQGHGKIRETTWAEVRRSCAEEQRVPSLEETIEFIAGRCRLNVEIKDPASWPFAKEILASVGQTRLGTSSWTESSGVARGKKIDIWFSSFDIGLMEQIAGEGFDVGLLFSFRRRRFSNAEIVSAAERIKPRALHLPAELFVPEIIDHSPVPIYVWTINDPAEALSLIERGASAIYSDDPGLIIDTLRLSR